MPSLVILFSTVLVLSCEQTHRITDAGKRFTLASVVGVSNKARFPLPELTALRQTASWTDDHFVGQT